MSTYCLIAFSGSAFVLTKEVYERLARESAPFDTRASSLLLSGRSVLPYDIYVWMTGSMKSLNHPLPITWDWLYERFGDGIGEIRNFKMKFRRALAKVHQVYPMARFDVSSEGLTLFSSPTAIGQRENTVDQITGETKTVRRASTRRRRKQWPLR